MDDHSEPAKRQNLQNSKLFCRYLNTHMQEHGTQDPVRLLNAHHLNTLDPNDVRQFVDNFAGRSEVCAGQVLKDNKDLNAVTAWCKLLHENGFQGTCNNELALALKTIADTELFPMPVNALGVNFPLLYRNLANMMMGHPVQEMNEATQTVLRQVYQTEVAVLSRRNKDREQIGEHLKEVHVRRQTSDVNSTEHLELETFFHDPNFNLFKFQL